MFKRGFDIVVSLTLIILLCVPLVFIALLIKLTSNGPIIHWSKRVGKDNVLFKMPKFRTMRVDTPQLASHLVENPGKYLTPIGGLLRKTSLDELPQLFSILLGDMSFVGPRPALFNQEDLISMRTAKGVHHLIPGLTGWAQINGRDEISVPVKVEFDAYYLKRRSFALDAKILCLTATQAFWGKGVSH